VNITVNVDEVTLATIVGEVIEYDAEDGSASVRGKKTIAHLVAEEIAGRVVKDVERWTWLRTKVEEIRAQMIREALAPLVEAAVKAPLQRTSGYGEPIGEPVTMTTVIVEEVRKYLKEPADSYRRENGTVLQKLIRDEVRAAFETEVKKTVAEARAAVAKEIGDQFGAQVAAGVAAALKK
jgi:hypothetical protein